MNKKVYISVLGETVIDGENDSTELVTEGEFAQRNGKYLLRYKEQLGLSEDACSTIIKIDTDTVVLTRTGMANTQMIFECGKRHISHYETPMGSFTIGVSTEKMDVKVDENGGCVDIHYVLDINNSATVKNKLNLSIRGEQS